MNCGPMPPTGADRIRSHVDRLPFSSVNELVEFADGSMGCATDAGVWQLRDGTLTEVAIGLPSERSKRNVRVLFESQDGWVWAGTSDVLRA